MNNISIHDLEPNCDLAKDIRKLDRQIWSLKNKNKRLQEALLKIQIELQPAANNRRYMQIARPARTCLNIIKLHTNS